MQADADTVPDRTLPAAGQAADDDSGDGPGYPTELEDLPTVPVDHYELIGEFAKGGIGRITEARDLRLDRVVAIKELRRNSGYAVARFAREVRITAKLQHPNIIPVHEAGRWPGGAPFFAMKMVAGGSLEESITSCVTMQDHLRLVRNVADVAEAMAYAHSHGIVHRDLKPSNVLVGPFGETVVIDWGLAKDLRRDDSDLPLVAEPSSPGGYDTTDGVILGTPPYMPPEQADGQAVDHRADVYALGAILYQVLSGRVPYWEHLARNVLDQVRLRPPTALAKLEPELPPDLLAIVDKAMARDPDDRYPDAGEMADELRRFTSGGLVAAYSYSLAELLKRFVGRNKAAVATGALGVVVLAVFGAWSVMNIGQERNKAVAEQQKARQAALVAEGARQEAERRLDEARLESARELVNRDPTRAVALLKMLSRPIDGAATVAADAVDHGVAQWVLEGHDDQIEAVAFAPHRLVLATSGRDQAVRLWNLSGGAPQVLTGHLDRVPALAFTPDGAAIVTASYDHEVRLYDAQSGKGRPLSQHVGPVKAVAVSPQGELVASVGDDGVRLWSLKTEGERWHQAARADRRLFVSFSRDGTRMLTGSHASTLRVWSTDGDHVALQGHDGPVHQAVFTPDGRGVASASEDGTIRLWSVFGEQERLLQGHDGGVESVAFTPAGRHLVSGGLDGTVRIWAVADGAGRIVARHRERISAIAVSPDGRQVASASWDRSVSVHDRVAGTTEWLRGHSDVVSALAFAPDGKHLATVSWDHQVRVWVIKDSARRTLRGHAVGVKTVAYSPDGKLVASGGHDDTVRLWDAATGESRKVLEGHGDHVFRVLFSPDGKQIASSSDDRTVRLWQVDGDDHRVLEGHQADVEELAYSPDGTKLASAGEDTAVGLWSTADGTGKLLRGHDQAVTTVTFTRDGAALVSASRDGTVRVWSANSGKLGHAIPAHQGAVLSAVVSPNGSLVASAGADDQVRLWSLADGALKTTIALADAERLRFSEDGTTLAVASSGAPLWLCKLAEPEPACRRLPGHTSRVHAFEFTGDGRMLVTGSGDGTVRLFDVSTAESRTLRGHSGPVFDVALRPDDGMVASASADTTIRFWPVTPPPAPQELATWLDGATHFVAPRSKPAGAAK